MSSRPGLVPTADEVPQVVVDADENVAEEGPGRVHGLVRNVRRLWFVEPGRHLLKLLTLVASQDLG